MGIVAGYLSLICFVLLAGKYIGRRTKCKKINCILKKLHKPVSGIFIMSTVLHFIFVCSVIKSRNWLVTFTGILSIVIAVLLIWLCHAQKQEKKKMFWHRLLTLVLLVIIAFHIIIYFLDFWQYQDQIREISISDVDVSGISDGTYTGEYDAGYIYAKVEVDVKDGKISDIRILEHRNERGQEAEVITEDMVRRQSVDVEAVSGATNSSLVIKKACENALKK